MIDIISDNSTLKRMLEQSMDYYQNYYWAVAWIGKPDVLYDKLVQNKTKIRCIVTGLFGTDNISLVTSADFVKEFSGLLNERYQRKVLFLKGKGKQHFMLHSKIYYFENSDSDWKLFVGSANFTNSAFTSDGGNVESVLVCDQDSYSNEDIKRFFEQMRSPDMPFRFYKKSELNKYLNKIQYENNK